MRLSITSSIRKYLFSQFKIHNFLTHQETQISSPTLDSDLLQKLAIDRQEWQKKAKQEKHQLMTMFVDKLFHEQTTITNMLASYAGKCKLDAKQQYKLGMNIVKKSLTYQYPQIIKEKNSSNYTKIYPYGNLVSIFNHSLPFLSACNYLIASLVSGSTLIYCPKVQCQPITELLINKWKEISNLSMINQFIFSQNNVEFLLSHEDTGYVSFSGKIQEGNKLYHSMAENSNCFAQSDFLLTSCDAAYVMEDANLSFAVKKIAKGISSHAGNTFCSLKRVYVDKSIKSKFYQLLLEELKLYQVNQRSLDDQSLALSSIRQQDMKNYIQLIKILQKEGTSFNTYQTINNQKGKFIQPIIFQTDSMPQTYLQSGSFNFPICKIEAVDHIPIQQINPSNLGITASLFTMNQQKAVSIGRALNVGVININTWQINGNIPYAPRKKSGKGFSYSVQNYQNITRTKGISF